MSELYMMTTITNRSMLPNFLGFYKEEGVTVNLVSLGRGTAASEVMDYFGLHRRQERDQVSYRASGFCEGGRDIEGYQP